MMILFWLLGGFFLAFCFGRNTIGNVFGSAIGIGALSQRFCAVLMGFFILLGACYGGGAVQGNIEKILNFHTPYQVFTFSIVLALLILFLTFRGLPVSIAHLGMGGLLGWNFAFEKNLSLSQTGSVFLAWLISPMIAMIIGYFLFKLVRKFLQSHPVSLLYKDLFVRFNLVWIGCFIAFALGQNNLSVLVAPFSDVFSEAYLLILSGMCLFIFLGTWTASKKVIKTWSKGLFPLSSLEAMLTGLSVALTMMLFSLKSSFIPAVPVSSAAALVGGIVGISLAKGGHGLQIKTLVRVALSWIWSPFISGLLCYVVSYILFNGEIYN